MKMRLNSCSRALSTTLLAALMAGLAGAQPFGGFQAASILPSGKVALESGRQLVVPVAVQVRSGFHINSNQPAGVYLIPTELTWENEILELQDVAYPPADLIEYKHSEEPLSVYSGKFIIHSSFSVPVQIPDSLIDLHGKLRYQACNEKACFPPTTLPVNILLISH